MEKNFLELYNNYKFRIDNYSPLLNVNDYVKSSSLWLDFLNNNSVKGSYYISEIIQGCTRNISYSYTSAAGTLYNKCWVSFEDYRYSTYSNNRYLNFYTFTLRGPYLGLVIIKILEKHFNTPFFDIPLVAGVETDFENIIESGVSKFIKTQNYFGFYMKNQWYRERKRKIKIKEFRITEVKFNKDSYCLGDLIVYIEDIKTGKQYRADDWNICFSMEHAKEKLNLLAENWRESDLDEFALLDYELKKLKEQLQAAENRKKALKNRLDNFDTEIKKILDI